MILSFLYLPSNIQFANLCSSSLLGDSECVAELAPLIAFLSACIVDRSEVAVLLSIGVFVVDPVDFLVSQTSFAFRVFPLEQYQ
jgi:hypothetical protein